jgi:hypothetical protein
MIQRMFKFSRVAALSLFGFAFGGLAASVTPASACGYNGCGGGVAVVQPYVYQSCSCCGCGSGYYGAAYAYPYYGYGAAYGYAAEYAPYAYVNRFYRPRIWVGPRRVWVR